MSETAPLTAYRRAANYLAAAQVYLRDNVLLEAPLAPEHIKPRLLGHWGTCPGINFIYTGLNRLIREEDLEVLLVTGPGHGAPANLANLWLEGSLEDIDETLDRTVDGMRRMIRRFSWPGGFPSHLAPLVPGTIHEGGELGYALATAFGAAFDSPSSIVACIVGDGEAETGPTAGAWHSTKFLDPVGDGAVLPFLHLNGYKIASPTIFGTMSDRELVSLFAGYGYAPYFVTVERDGEAADQALASALDASLQQIREIQGEARTSRRPDRPRWPMIIVKSPKGWTGIDTLEGTQIEGTFRSHQVPAKNARTDETERRALEAWLRSYEPAQMFDERGRLREALVNQTPRGARRMGANPRANGGELYSPLVLPDLGDAAVEVGAPGEASASALEVTGTWLSQVIRQNESAKNFRIVCPDELDSNKLSAVLEATQRTYQWPLSEVDVGMGPSGRVMEVLSEHNCQGWLQGYVLTGRHGLFPCYEAFAAIVDGMVNQYAKFLKMAKEVPWRKPVASFNYLLTSEGWRQEHNGYSHQGPGFINTLLNKKASVTRIYLPPDANTLLVTMEQVLQSTGAINLVVASKNPLPTWLGLEEARAHCRAGASVWRWACTDGGEMPDAILAGAGNIPMVETIAAAQLVQRDAPGLRLRVVNVCDLLSLEHPADHPHGLSEEDFEALFTKERPVVFGFHGYPAAVHQLIYHRPNPSRFHVKGYIEEGTTTTPFDLLVANGVSRYHLALEVVRRASGWSSVAGELSARYKEEIRQQQRYIREHGEDPEHLRTWRAPEAALGTGQRG